MAMKTKDSVTKLFSDHEYPVGALETEMDSVSVCKTPTGYIHD